jgi:hypothetical protein
MKFKFLNTVFLFSVLLSCSKGDDSTDSTPPQPTLTPAVTNLALTDIGNNGDGRDLELKFNKISNEDIISGYKGIIVKESSAGSFTLSNAEALSSDKYTSINKNGNNQQIVLTQTVKDSDGNTIVESQGYKAFVLSVGTGGNLGDNKLSSASNTVILTSPVISAPVVNSIVALDVSNNGNSKDIEVKFNKASDETLISEYRLIVVKSSGASSFDLTSAESLSSDKYMVVSKNGSNQVLELNNNLKDSDGDTIIEDVDYKVFIISIADGVNATINSLSIASNNIILQQVNAIRTLTKFTNVGTGGMQVDSNGNIYMGNFGLTDNGGGTNVYKITPDGQSSIYTTGLNTADGNDIDSNGNFYQVSYSNHTIFKIDTNGIKTTFASGGLLNGPIGIAIDVNDDLFVTNYNNNTVIKITQSGTNSLIAEGGLLNGPNGLDFDSSGNLYISNFNSNQILKINFVNNSIAPLASTPNTRNAHMVINNDILYVAGRNGHQIYKITLGGVVTTFIGTGVKGELNGTLNTATICWPNDIAFNSNGTKMYLNMVDPSVATSNIISPSIIKEISIVE